MSDLLVLTPYLALALVVVLGLPYAWQMGRDDAFRLGYERGKRDGHDDGYLAGIKAGVKRGHKDGVRTGELLAGWGITSRADSHGVDRIERDLYGGRRVAL